MPLPDDLDPLQQQLQLRDINLTRIHPVPVGQKTALLEPLVTYLEMQALGLPQNILSASLTRSTRSADSNFFVSVSAITGLADVSCCASTTRVIAPFLRSGPI